MANHIALILNQDGTTSEVTYSDKESLKTLQAAVGGYIESVDGYGFGMDAYANEEGLYTEGLTVNPHMLAVFGVPIMGNIVLPKMTPNKRARLIKKGFDLQPA